MRLAFILAGFVLAGVALPAWAGEHDRHGKHDMARSISVQGMGAVSARPDIAVLHAGVTAQAASARAALSEHNQVMAGLLATLKDFGLEARDVQSRRADLRAIYPSRRQQDAAAAPIAFRATGNVRIRLREVDRLGDLLDRMTAAGVNNLAGLGFTVAEPEPLQDEARKLAIRDARRRAQVFAAEAGVQLGPVLRISEGGTGAPMRELRALASASAGNPMAPGETEIRVGVSMVFAIKKAARP